LLLNALDSTFDKESWYAPFKHAIEGLTAEQAMWKPSGEETNTIWENVNHLIYYGSGAKKLINLKMVF